MSENTTDQFFKSTVLGHPAGLFVLFFTEMWERFSFYGMRSLLILFLTASFTDGGWEWTRENASALFGSYVGLVYLSTMLGGYFADKVIGFRWAVVVGASLMTLGHASMAVETEFSIYLGLVLLVFGNGFFKPNMTSIVSEMYKDRPEKKDGAYTLFYMGVNAGAFFGILLCGYLGEKVGWTYGFGLAGIFMFFGMLQFWLSQNIFGDIGLKPNKESKAKAEALDTDKRNPFSPIQLAAIAFSSLLALLWLLNDPASKISGGKVNVFSFLGPNGNSIAIVSALVVFIILLIYRFTQYSKITKEKLIAVTFFAFLTIFFWAIFEQSPNSLTIFANDYTDRVLTGNWSVVFLVMNSLITILPLVIITWVLILLFKQTFKLYAIANIILSVSFIIIWAIAIWMLAKDYYTAGYLSLSDETLQALKIDKVTTALTEVPATWFSTLNSLFIISLAPLFSKWWESKYNPAANLKYGIGMGLLALGMACVAFGASGIEAGAKTASVSMIWLILVYLFHTMAELCISPVGLSYVSKLVPARMIAFMFGVWYLAVAIGMKGAGMFGENIDKIANEHGLSYFFWMLAIISIVVALFSILMGPVIKKLMHGVR
ncbi:MULTISPECIES: peptide MFS transporter [Flavobacterium]|jgi:POT family proton-dependent oligopeptide transporter|uniref:Peptide MFS transporter n=1 Tax=Flavobacterium algoritolerans TaxID=3041254 RepID=A0ABT6VAK9_9FLAO|nr:MULTISPECIES: peptide MFS transporter [Flavobacterium]MDI5888910.1 peptide MFS transporter [Flavobacterium yafengii]MDI5895268.1 peptide MFS transporter [Flavobacterium algoritolerans]PIF60935.1 POT family proton-dependent oligopeptide transporter [Flavobacterium sp. 11]RKS13069.1 POT family proton-dependent oligopeptide transporter [Flavobacterium sp. 120]WKL45323.1 peptide MFS transporter [Flavobacterium sp. ZE23DGlu08]